MPEEFCSENNLFFFFSLYPISGRNLRLYYRSVIAAGAEDYVKPTMPIQSPCVTRTHTRPGGGCTRKMRKCVRSRCNEATNKWMHHDECPQTMGDPSIHLSDVPTPFYYSAVLRCGAGFEGSTKKDNKDRWLVLGA